MNMKQLVISLLLVIPILSRLLEETDIFPSCPKIVPENDSDCSDQYNVGIYICSWGEDPRYNCRTHAECVKDYTNTSIIYWKVTEGTCGVGDDAGSNNILQAVVSDPKNVSFIDESYDECSSLKNDDICQEDGSLCSYEDGSYCLCTNIDPYPCFTTCSITPEIKWKCIPPMDNDVGCPTIAPNAGTECSDEATKCIYTCEHVFDCVNGIWQYRVGRCPNCAAPNTLIATPSGHVPISNLNLGDLVLSVDKNGEKTIVPVAQVSKTPVRNHHVVKVILENDTTLLISPGHPTADGRTFNDLKSGDYLHQSKILSAEIIAYSYDHTYDILPQSDSGFYFAENVLIGSTLHSTSSSTKLS